MRPYFHKRNLFGVEIYDTKRKDLIYILSNKIDQGEKIILFGISTAAFGSLKFRRDLFSIYKKMDICIAEGAGLPLFAKLFGSKITEKVGIFNITYDLLELANKKGYRVLFFGATKKVNCILINKVQKNYPGIKVCEGIDGYFDKEEIPKIIDKINKEKPDILFIGISYPIKERFSVKYKNVLNTKLIVPCGGVFDVIAGKISKKKEISKYLPTAWFFRFIQEPRRLFKPIIITILYSVFILLPRLILVHFFIQKNPSIADMLNLRENDWNPEKDSVK